MDQPKELGTPRRFSENRLPLDNPYDSVDISSENS